jgi:hypothetical protein
MQNFCEQTPSIELETVEMMMIEEAVPRPTELYLLSIGRLNIPWLANYLAF